MNPVLSLPGDPETRLCRVEQIDPISDPRWSTFVDTHPSGTVFHTAGWMKALAQVYGFGFSALVLADRSGHIQGGLPFCRVDSWMTGRRIVAMPFCDHCDPLANDQFDLSLLLERLAELAGEARCRYAEIRPTRPLPEGVKHMQPSQSFWLHRIDLRPGEGEVFRGLHRDGVRRHIRRAEKLGLHLEVGSNPRSVAEFYRLVVKTRRRHGLPPQPLVWFEGLLSNFADKGQLYLLYQGNYAIAGILTLRNSRSLVYKYGASDEQFHNTGAMPYLLWQAAKSAIAEGLQEFDLGRSDIDNDGLVAFKDHFGATRTMLTYYRAQNQAISERSHDGWKMRIASRVCSHLPDAILCSIGSVLYRHVA